MRLINKLTIWYLAITTLVLLASGVIVFYRVQAEIENEVKQRLRRDIQHVAEMLEEGVPVESIKTKQIDIVELRMEEPLVQLHVTDSMGTFSWPMRAVDRKFTVGSSFKVRGKHYYISAYNFIAEPDEILEGIIASLGVTLVILLAFVGITSRQMSNRILSNFNKTLKIIQRFSLKQKHRMKLGATNTHEFKELNQFLEKMTNKALDDYHTLKEFSENASHELQTPVAIIRGKLELLLETPIDEKQAALIEGIQNAVQKLSSINQSLILLTRLENQEYPVDNKINFTLLVENSLAAFRELIEMKSLVLTKSIRQEVYLALHPMLGDILFTNLLSNAIRHNHPNGTIHVTLTSSGLVVENTGDPPGVPTGELFKRFKKGKQNADSTGLGLAIAKQICDLNNFNVQYEYKNGLHVLGITFLPAK
jgi:signal transduction histidine kinase